MPLLIPTTRRPKSRIKTRFGPEKKIHPLEVHLDPLDPNQVRTVRDLCLFFRSTSNFQKLALNTKSNYAVSMGYLPVVKIRGITFDKLLVEEVDRRDAFMIYEYLAKRAKPTVCSSTIVLLRRLWSLAWDYRLVKSNPFQGMRIPVGNRRTDIWTRDQVYRCINRADRENLSSIGTLILLCYQLCQRPGDMLNLTPDNLEKVDNNDVDNNISFVQQKTKTPLTLPCSKELKNRLDKYGLPLINTETRRPYVSREYFFHFRKIKNLEGLEHLQLRDLRRTGATELAESGCSDSELMAVTGHKTREVLSTYVNIAPKMALHAMRKRMNFRDDSYTNTNGTSTTTLNSCIRP